jgi:O-succinylbenzoic acid--CoA ligase
MQIEHFNSDKIAIYLKNSLLSYKELGALLKWPPSVVTATPSLETIVAILSAFVYKAPLFLKSPHTPSFCPVIPEYPGLYFATSGSSGTPKVVFLTFESLLINAEGVNSFLNISHQDRWLLNLPLFHVGGVGVILRMILAHGSIILANSEPTILSLVPTQLFRLINEGKIFKKAKYIIGGGHLCFDLQKRAQNLDLYLSYGMTEMGSTITLGRKNLGQPLANRCLSFGLDNEILLDGTTLFQGYVENGKLLQTKRPFGSKDVGQIDSNGNLQILGRKDRMFIKGGENIHPEEIEKALLSIEGVEEAVVFSIKDREYGHLPVGFIKTNYPLEKVFFELKNILPKFKLPQRLYPLPHYPGLKVDKASLLKVLEHP